MKIEQIYTGCLYQASYFIESNGESAVIDPLRESDIYLDKVKKTKSKLFQLTFFTDVILGNDFLILLSKKLIFLPKFFVAHKYLIFIFGCFDNIKIRSNPVYPVAPTTAIFFLLYIDIISYIIDFNNS